MAIVVTGADGFLGREVVARLLAASSAEIVATDLGLPSLPNHPRLRLLEGDLGDAATRAGVLETATSLIHLAAVPGGAAERDPGASRRVNVDATLDLLDELARSRPGARVIYASTVAVLGDPLPESGVDGDTIPRPRLIYGAHKLAMEVIVGALSRRGAINGISLRLPGILARPAGASGLKSAFMSELFHAALAGESFTAPVSSAATLWVMSVQQAARNMVHALSVPAAALPDTRVLTLPALRVTMADLLTAVARSVGNRAPPAAYAPDPVLEAAFGMHPPLSTPAADRAGFSHDGSLDALVASAMASIAGPQGSASVAG